MTTALPRSLPSVDSTRLTWFAAGRQFSAMITDLRDLFPQGVPVAVAVKSQRTGTVKHFDFKDVARDLEGEVIGWVYRNPETNTTLYLFND